MRIIPAIDIMNRKCVRLTKGDYATQKIYSENPVEVAKSFMDAGLKFLHLVDLDGAKAKKVINYKVIEAIAVATNLTIDFGGGINTDADLEIAVNSGASQVTVGSLAVSNPEKVLDWLSRYGAEKFILGADCRAQNIATNGWLDQSDLNVVDFIKLYNQRGIQSVICTDIDKDGMLEGPSIDLYSTILKESKINLIASGGISSIDDLILLKEIGCEGAIIGKAIYENQISLKKLSELC